MSWQLTVKVHHALYNVIEAIAAKANAPVVGELKEARKALAELTEFVETKEECEEP